MPLSLLLLLSPTHPLPNVHLGREAQAWFLHQIEALDPLLSKSLHDACEVKPYTVSDLFALPPSSQANQAGCAIRLTAFSEELESLVAGRLVQRLPEKFNLWYGELRIEQAFLEIDSHPWAGQAGFGRLVQAAHAQPAAGIQLDFITPTAFRSEGIDLVLPLPHLLFRGYWQKWNANAPQEMRMDDGLPEFVKDCLVVESLQNLNTERIVLADGKRGGATGFTGRVTLRFWRAEKGEKWAAEWKRYQEMVRALALFSFYCGTGHHTTIGLGQTYPSLIAGR